MHVLSISLKASLAVALLSGILAAQDPAKLLKSKDVDQRIDGIEQLENQGGDKAEKLLSGALKDRDWEVVERAVQALAVRGSEASLKPLLALALDGDILRLRVRAADTLAAIAAEPASAELAKDARGRNATRAVEALARMARTTSTDKMREGIERGLDSSELNLKVAAARGLPAFPMDEQLERLPGLLRDKPVVTAAALDGIRARPDPKYLPLILTRLQDGKVGDVVERRLAAAFLDIVAQAGDPDAAATLAAPLFDAIGGASGNVLVRLTRLAGLLGRSVPDENGEPTQPLVDGEKVREALAPAIGARDEAVRAAAVQALHRVRNIDAMNQVLEMAATDTSARVRGVALNAAVDVKTVEHVGTFNLLCDRLANDSSTRVREDAATHLGAFELNQAVPHLLTALGDEDWVVAVAAAVSLGKTRDVENALGPLTELYDHKDWKLSGAAVVGLGWLHSKEAVPTLIDALGSKHQSVRQAAYGFLNRMTNQSMPLKKSSWSSWWKKEGDSYVFVDREKSAQTAKKYGYAPTSVGVYEDLDVLVFQSRGDHIEQLLETLGVKHRLTQLGQVPDAGCNPFGIYVANCSGEAQPEDLEQVAWFVRVGGYLFSSCWALEHHIARIYPGVVRRLPTNGQVLDNVIAEPCPTDSALLQGVFDGITRPVYRLEGAFLIDVIDPERVEVLIDSPEAATRWGGGNLACWFRAGHGVILDSVNHFDLQGLEKIEGLKKPQERMAWAMDHMGLDYDALRHFSSKKVWNNAKRANEEVRDLSAFRFITNFVRQKRRQDR